MALEVARKVKKEVDEKYGRVYELGPPRGVMFSTLVPSLLAVENAVSCYRAHV